ncbi:hypothetical protein YPPY76_1129, partial [Yersinia pestis PY-76]
MEHDCL